ncbi:MAG: polymer-forming cytoskeletal protein [Candidatus Omnitrophota bacterium]|nr:MAG: polymer-forming cytoskeletal protein [Candidatus Omnitrophota bacterium]
MPKIMGRRRRVSEEKVLDVDASMQGSMVFKDPVNLRINGKFEGSLNTRGNLTIGGNAVVNADIEGDDITVAGTVNGNINAKTRLKIIAPAKVTGDVRAPILSIQEGAILQGKCKMGEPADKISHSSKTLSLEEVAEYLEVEPSVLSEWVSQGKIPARKNENSWRFEKAVIDEWVSKERVK